MRNLITLVAVVASATAFAPTPAIAHQDARSVTVSHADLDLATDVGRATLDRRIGAAARRVCDVEHSRELARWQAERRCVASALDRSGVVSAQLAAKQKAERLAGGTIMAARR